MENINELVYISLKVHLFRRSRLTQSLVKETPQDTKLNPSKYDMQALQFYIMDLPFGSAQLRERQRERERESTIKIEIGLYNNYVLAFC